MAEALMGYPINQTKHMSASNHSFVQKPSLAVVGINWPMENHLTRLLLGLAESGFSITIVSPEKPDSSLLSHAGFQWLRVPVKQGHTLINAGGKDPKQWDLVYFPTSSKAVSYRDNEKLCFIRPAVDVSFFAPPERIIPDEKKFRIISVGSLVWRKGYEQALMVIRDLVDRKIPVRFEIIGEGEEYQLILFTIQDMNLDQHVQLHRKLTATEIRNKLQQSDVFLLSSLEEDIPGEALAAMACGLPVVTMSCSSMSEAITNGVEGFIVPAMDPHSAADALEVLWEKPDLRSKMGTAGRNRIVRDFTIERQIDQFQELCTT